MFDTVNFFNKIQFFGWDKPIVEWKLKLPSQNIILNYFKTGLFWNN